MMSTSSWVSRVLCESLSAHLDDNCELTEAVSPLSSAATTCHTTQRTQTVKRLSSNILGTRGSTAAREPPPPPVAAFSVASPRNATLASLASTPGGSAFTAATLPTAANAALPVAVTSASAALPALPPIVDDFAGVWTPQSSGSGLSPETDTSTSSSCRQQEAAVHMLLPPARPSGVTVTSATALPLLSNLNADTPWHGWTSRPTKLLPTAFRHDGEGYIKEEEHHGLVERSTVAEKASLEKLTTAASTPAFTAAIPVARLANSTTSRERARLPSPVLIATMPAATLTTPPPPREPAAPRSETKGKATEPLAPVLGKKTLRGELAPHSSATPSVTHDPVVGPEIPTGAAAALMQASRGGAPKDTTMKEPPLIARSSATAEQDVAAKKVIENDSALELSSQFSSQTCAPASTCVYIENSRSQSLREDSSTCGVQGDSSQESGIAERLRVASNHNANGAGAKPAVDTVATTTSDTKKSMYHETALPPGALSELAALCAVDAATTAVTDDSFEATYMDAFVASLPPAGGSPANSPSPFSPAICLYPSSAAYSASPHQVPEPVQEGVVHTRAPGNGSRRSTEDKSDRSSNNSVITTVNPDTNGLTSRGRCSNSRGTGSNALASSSSCTRSTKTGDNAIYNNSSECSSASFLPSLLPLLSHIKALSVSAGGTPNNLHDFGGSAAAVTPCTPSSGGEALISGACYDSSGHLGTQRQLGNDGGSPKRTSPYFPFFSFNSISSAFQSPAVSHLSRKSFCTMPLSLGITGGSSAKVDSAAAVNARSSAAALSFDLPPEAGLARAAPENLSSARGHGGKREGPAAARTMILPNGITRGKATGPQRTGAVSPSEEEPKAFAQPAATTVVRTQIPGAGARPVSSGGKTELASHRKAQQFSAASGAGAAGVATTGLAIAAASASSALSSCAAESVDRPSPQLGAIYAAEQKPKPFAYSKVSSNSSVIGSSPNYSSVTSGVINGAGNSKDVSHVLSPHARRSPECHGLDPQRLSTTLQQVDWSGCFVSNSLQMEAATALTAGGCTSAVDEMYCMQTPSRTRFTSVRISPLLSQVYAASDNGILCVWNMTGCCQRPLIINSYHSKAITELDISPDGQLLASASLDGTIRLKYTASATHVVHPSCAFATDPHRYTRPSSVLSSRALPAAHLHFTSLSTGTHQHNAAYHGKAITSQIFDSYHLSGASPSAHVCPGLHGTKLSGTSSSQPVPPCPPCCYPQPSSVDISHASSVLSSNRLLLSASAARAGDVPSPPPTNLRRSTSGEQQLQQHTVRGHSNAVVSLHFSSDGALLLSASRDKSAKLWKNPSLDFLAAFTGHTNWVCCARFAPISASAPVTFASCAEDRTVRIWNAERKVPVLLFRLCEGFQSTSAATLFGALGSGNTCQDTGTSSRAWGRGLAATGATSTSNKFGPCLKSCRFVFGGASVLAGGSSDGTITLWDVRQEPKAPSQYYNASWLQSAPLYSTASNPGSSVSSSCATGCTSRNSSMICDTDRKGAVRKAGISYLDATVDGNSLLALSTSGVAHLIDLRYNKPLFSVGHTKTPVLTHNTVLVARGKKTSSTHSNRLSSFHGSKSPHIDSVSTHLSGTAATSQTAAGNAPAATSAQNVALAGTTADAETAAGSQYQQQQRQKRTAAVITAASFGPVLKKYERLPHLQQQRQVLATADAEGKVVVWRWDLASPQMLYMHEYQAAAAAANFCTYEKSTDPFRTACSPYTPDNFGSFFTHKTAEDCMQAYAFAEEETRATEADYIGGTSCTQTAENYSFLDAADDSA